MLSALPADKPAGRDHPGCAAGVPAGRAEACRMLPVPRPPLPEPVMREGAGLFHLAGAVVRGIGSMLEWLFGAAVLMVGLAVLAALPVLQFLSLGYLLEAGGRVARTGRLRDGFIGVRLAARLGGVVLGSLAAAAAGALRRRAGPRGAGDRSGRPRGPPAGGIGLLVLIGLTALHIAAACARGGRLRHFVWPFNVIWLLRRLLRGGYYAEARDAVWDVVVSLRLPYYFWLGFRGFVGALAWLVAAGHAAGRWAACRPPRPGSASLGGAAAGRRAAVPAVPADALAAANRLSAVFDAAGGAPRLPARRRGRSPWPSW